MILFLLSAAFIAYVLVGYPLLLEVWSRLLPSPITRKFTPRSVSILLPVHNGERWLAEKRLLDVDTTTPGILVLRLFNYPLWKIEDNGQKLRTETRPHTGEMVIPLRAGENHIRITFVDGWDRALGALISALAVAAIEVMRRRSRSAVPRVQQ